LTMIVGGAVALSIRHDPAAERLQSGLPLSETRI
jgi:hypothetical protein